VRRILPLILGLAALAGASGQDDDTIVVTEAVLHLGNDEVEDWPEASRLPDAQRLELEFPARRHARECVLVMRHRDVNDPWTIRINGRDVGQLVVGAERAFHAYPVPPSVLLTGTNRLEIESARGEDDITIGEITLHLHTLREHFDLRPLDVRVLDAATGKGIPARITIVSVDGERPDVYYADTERHAVRPGIVYTADGPAHLEVPAGKYRVTATRGPEWSLASAPVDLAEGVANQVELELRHEVEVAADTHIHTLQFSGHGDASALERVVTLAGEGVELAIATDHNHNTDYRPFQRELRLERWFTPVTGNEVTTDLGHFNAFPLEPGDPVPDFEKKTWQGLADEIRSKGARAVILNHPRWPEAETGPFGVTGLDRFTGERAAGTPLPVDAMELINSTTLERDPLFLFGDWFALLNHGERIAAVGSSDSHTVGDPVGQGRTYVPSATDDPARIDPDAAAEAIAEGRTTISMGIFVELRVASGEPGAGDLASGRTFRVDRARTFSLELRVASPSWVRPRRALFFVNGFRVAEHTLEPTPGLAFDERIVQAVPVPEHDAWVVCVVLGDGVADPSWTTLNPYTLAATNPVRLDVEGGPRGWSSPRETAARWLGEDGGDPRGKSGSEIAALLAAGDDAVGVQLLSLLRARLSAAAFAELAAELDEHVKARPPLHEYLHR
jgi:hypothetical protein